MQQMVTPTWTWSGTDMTFTAQEKQSLTAITVVYTEKTEKTNKKKTWGWVGVGGGGGKDRGQLPLGQDNGGVH